MTDQADVRPVRLATVFFCWLLGGLHIASGLTRMINEGSIDVWSVLQIAGGAFLLPPILRRWIPPTSPFSHGFLLLFLGVFALPMMILQNVKLRAPHKSSSQHSAPPPSSVSTAKIAARPITPMPTLNPKPRFLEVPEGHSLRPVQDALNKGDVDLALRVLNERQAVNEADRGLKKRLVAAIQRASDEQLGTSPAKDYVERINTYWLPQIRGISAEISSDDDLVKARNELTKLAIDVKDGEILDLSAAEKRQHRKFADALAAKQRQVFPAMRRHYAAALGAKLFRRDVLVSTEGAGDATLLLTGRMFSFNANIEDAHKVLSDAAAQLRFKKISYRWSAYVDERTTLKLPPVSDSAIPE